MKYITVHMHGGARAACFMFRDHALADLGYEKIKSALAQHREFGNDKDGAVSVKGDDGSEITLKLAHLSAIGIEDPATSADLHEAHTIRLGKSERLFRETAGLDSQKPSA